MLKRSWLLWFFLASSSFGGVGWAQEVFSPLPGNFLVPLSPPEEYLGCRLHLRLALANHLSYASGSWGELGFDLEEIRAELGIGLREEAWGLGLFFPLSLYYGGVMDYVLDPLHQVLGLPRNLVQGQVLLFARKGGEERRWEGSVWGPRDPYLRLDLNLGQTKAIGAVAFPLGSVERFLGSGGTRILLGGGWEEKTIRVWGGVLWPLGPQPGLEPFSYGPALMGALRWEILGVGPLALEVHGFVGPLREAGPFAQGLILKFSYGQLSFAEDGSRGLPDVVFSWRVSAPCPLIF